MTLTSGRGPFSGHPAGRFSEPMPGYVVYTEPHRRRVRGMVAGRALVDSERVLLVHRPGRPPAYAFAAGDVGDVPSEPEPEAPGYVTVPWEAVDTWVEEEDQPVVGHPKNPYHRVDCLRARRRLRVEVAGTVLVDTADTVVVHETALEPRLYVRRAAVRMDLLSPSTTRTYCAYKGWTSYWHATAGGVTVPDVAWSYDEPFAESAAIAGLLSFDEASAAVTQELPAPAR